MDGSHEYGNVYLLFSMKGQEEVYIIDLKGDSTVFANSTFQLVQQNLPFSYVISHFVVPGILGFRVLSAI